MDNFVARECERCGGPILNEPWQSVDFIEETLDYVSITLWPCYACGYQNTLGSKPHYVF